jgi:hypothetical protein
MPRTFTPQFLSYCLPAVWALSIGLWLSACSSATNAWLEYQRSGGFLGLDDRLTIQANGEAELTRHGQVQAFALNADQLAELQANLDEASFSTLQANYMPTATGGDRIEYVVRVSGKSVKTADGAVPAALQPLLKVLNQIVESQGLSQGATP